jgi:hypothetical protein
MSEQVYCLMCGLWWSDRKRCSCGPAFARRIKPQPSPDVGEREKYRSQEPATQREGEG